ncbi:hypothetical protein BU24DRAFT_276493 [Aaosphaeria arxii CBS 175.79]|uniref:RED-like N-terminal domain-containing protein n=1 Tax=Aaosphaeria arxii CBS 175.79 TaxID=1450172 RepID=A0A6A5XHR2_9PLEO|nr:uncharacterized protein BU24DRAFT_276493 [Aaosphaeria arxii CBS 175.79]KAF2012396.1 hypothetical protein BU24DRAFT_276493 [Aaosphaeria arxii CBS 175.79]
MDNQQFRRLLLANSQKSHDSQNHKPPPPATSTSTLGSRKHSNIPMTPRQVGRSSVNSDFARQLAERNARGAHTKKWKSSAPKGVKLAAGYIDRTKLRTDDDTGELAQRVKALEEAMKLGQIDRDTFDKLVQEITDGDIDSTHYVKGLDRKLLDRIRKGEDVHDSAKRSAVTQEDKSDLEDEFDEIEQRELVPLSKEEIEKKGETAPLAPVAGAKRNRDAILAELKAQRKAAMEAEEAEREKHFPSLGPGFRKVGFNGETTRIEVDSKGREVLIITDANGKEKRKVRKKKTEETVPEPRYDLDEPSNPIKIPEAPAETESEDEDIFAGVGSSYNPLVDIEDGDDSSSEGATSDLEVAGEATKVKHKGQEAVKSTGNEASPSTSTSMLPEPLPRRNYFGSTPESTTSRPSAGDATVLAALKKVRTMDPSSTLLQTDEEARLQKRAKMLAANDRDMEDIDMGFGSSRFDDAEEMERDGEAVKFSEWKGLGAEDEDDEGDGRGRGASKRKRGPKKKKGDKHSALDVMKVMDRQKENKTLG